MCRLSRSAKNALTGLLLTMAALTVNGQTVFPEQLNYECLFTSDSITIDGKGNEATWRKAPWTEDFGDIEGAKKPKPVLRTRVKMLWNDRYLFVFAEMQEPALQASLHRRDTIIYQDNDFEIFIDPNGDTHQYFEIEVNAHNTIMDLFMAKPYRNGGNAMINWDVKGLHSAVQLYGTLNQPNDRDSAWTVEMAIPFSALATYKERVRPQENTRWRINFSRVQWDWDVVNGQYQKRKGANGRPLPEHNWVWSPQGIVDMHAPERWGNLWFRNTAGGTAAPSAEDEAARRLLWTVYYKQQQYRRQKGSYATATAQLELTGSKGLKLEATSRQFNARVQSGNTTWIIDQEGRITMEN
ncbi:carbohydrate-binding family 9-like protein [Chitinophaga horti]|uniref:Carbohydrate-binding family 9-like protein n=1 Tax=Chitinophaga horti TaxID=2920382 RepID=A0ABY6J1V6_9BACT|nr:carbohydrate-binding family 9-like protein [Chitinophaga horti]UYQ92617.1 carbohydrate-binding family 9-like protein [Chitinophaga horti]